MFCDDCGRVLNRATGRCVCEDDARDRVPVLVGAGVGVRMAEGRIRQGTWTTGAGEAGSVWDLAPAHADEAPSPLPSDVVAPPVTLGIGIPRVVDEAGDVVDLVVYEDAIVVSRFGVAGEVDAAPRRGLSARFRLRRIRQQNERRLAKLTALPAEQALMTESRNRLVPVRRNDRADVRPTRDGGVVTLHLAGCAPRSFGFVSSCSSIEDVEEALRLAFTDRLSRRRPRLATVLGTVFDLLLTLAVLAISSYLVWSFALR